VAENEAACRAFNASHTIAGQQSQPYHLPCGRARGVDLNDSLIALGFGVPEAGGQVVPLVLVLRFQRAGGGGYAVDAAAPFVEAIFDYFAGPAR
jgi:hypothetical protein